MRHLSTIPPVPQPDEVRLRGSYEILVYRMGWEQMARTSPFASVMIVAGIVGVTWTITALVMKSTNAIQDQATPVIKRMEELQVKSAILMDELPSQEFPAILTSNFRKDEKIHRDNVGSIQ